MLSSPAVTCLTSQGKAQRTEWRRDYSGYRASINNLEMSR